MAADEGDALQPAVIYLGRLQCRPPLRDRHAPVVLRAATVVTTTRGSRLLRVSDIHSDAGLHKRSGRGGTGQRRTPGEFSLLLPARCPALPPRLFKAFTRAAAADPPLAVWHQLEAAQAMGEGAT